MNKVGILGVVIGVAGLAYSAYVTYKMNKIANKLDKTIKELAENTEVEIKDEVVTKAVVEAADRESRKSIEAATRAISNTIETEMNKKISEAVNSQYEKIHEEITDRVSKEVAEIDIDKLKQDIEKRASDMVVRKFDGSLDHLLDKFNGELNSVSKIYRSISDTMVNTNQALNRVGLTLL